MPVVEELIRTEQDGTISFGNYKLNTKSKKDNYEHDGDLYKIKTFYEITKLERNGMCEHFRVDDAKVEFQVEGSQDAQVTLQLEEDCEYEVFVDGASIGGMKTNMSGKLVIGVELNEGTPVTVKVIRK